MVKGEIFGSRKSIIKEKLERSKEFELLNNIWFCTCLKKFNEDPLTRYIIFYECKTYNEFVEKDITYIRPFFNRYVPIFKVYIDEKAISFFDVDSNKIIKKQYNRDGNNEEAAKFILNKVGCLKGILYKAETRIHRTEDVSEFSVFLRRDLFGRLGSTDIDFIILFPKQNRLVFIEEKLFMEDKGGTIGKGEYRSFKELLNDVIEPNTRFQWYILFFDKPTKKWFCYDFKNEPKNHEEIYDRKRYEWRILISKEEMKEVDDIDNFISNMERSER